MSREMQRPVLVEEGFGDPPQEVKEVLSIPGATIIHKPAPKLQRPDPPGSGCFPLGGVMEGLRNVVGGREGGQHLFDAENATYNSNNAPIPNPRGDECTVTEAIEVWYTPQ